MKRQDRKAIWIMALFGGVVVIWLALLSAPYARDGLFSLLNGLNRALRHPFSIRLCADTGRTLAWFLFIYLAALLFLCANLRNTRYGAEHGSSRWGNPTAVNRKLQTRTFSKNRILTQNVRIGFRFFWHKRNLNVAVVGGSGAQKTRGYAMPNILQANCSMIVTDPKGEILRGCGAALEEQGTEVRVLDLIEMRKSHHYNPFRYLRNENDVQTMVTTIFAATSKKGANSIDPFFENTAQILLKAFCLYLWLEAPPEEQNFAMVMELLRAAAFHSEDPGEKSITDILFDRLEEKEPTHSAVKAYRSYRTGGIRTLQSVQVVLASHLEKFDLEELKAITSDDELNIRELGEKKIALFLRISDSDPSFNFLVSILYIQVIQQLFDVADRKYHGPLPVHVHFLMDEFANVALPEEFDNYLSTMRSRNMSASIILQNITQLKALYEKKWESILGNCDEFLYLGGNEQSTHKYVSEAMDKETIWTRSMGLQRGAHGHSNRNDQTTGRELMTPGEVRMLDSNDCILLVRGFPPVLDRKYDLTQHPLYAKSAMGGGQPYEHGRELVEKQKLTAQYPWANEKQLSEIAAAIREGLPRTHIAILALPDWTAEQMRKQRMDYHSWKNRHTVQQHPQYTILTDAEVAEMLR